MGDRKDVGDHNNCHHNKVTNITVAIIQYVTLCMLGTKLETVYGKMRHHNRLDKLKVISRRDFLSRI